MSDAAWTPAGSDGSHQYSAAALSVFWPESEYRAVIARWPGLSAHLGSTWDEHRQRTEQYCVAVDRRELRVQQIAGDIAGFERFLMARSVTTPTEKDLQEYPDLRTVSTALVAWPPNHFAPCWCGSGRKYKKCCRPRGQDVD